MMLQIRPDGVAHFAPVRVVHIVPESLVHYAPVEVVHYTPVCSLLGSIQIISTSQPTPGGMQNYSLAYDNISKVVLNGNDYGGYHNMDDLSFNNTSAPTPEPASMMLLGTGLAALAGARKLKKQQQPA